MERRARTLKYILILLLILILSIVVAASIGAAKISLKDTGVKQTLWRDILLGDEYKADGNILKITIKPYGIVWLKPSG